MQTVKHKTQLEKQKHNLQIASQKLEKEDQERLKQFNKLDNRTNTFLSISLGVFSLQITILTGNILNIYSNLLEEHKLVAMLLLILYIANILFNIESIVNFRRSSKISEKIYSNKEKTKLFSNGDIEEINLLKKEIFIYYQNIKKK